MAWGSLGVGTPSKQAANIASKGLRDVSPCLTRRLSLPNSVLTSGRLRSEETETNSLSSRTRRNSSETLKSSKEFIKEFQQFTQNNRKKLSFEDEELVSVPRSSDSEQSVVNVRESVVAEIHQAESRRVKYRSTSHESLAFRIEPTERKKQASFSDTITKDAALKPSRVTAPEEKSFDFLEALAQSKLISSGSRPPNLQKSYFNDLYPIDPHDCDYRYRPPSPASTSPEFRDPNLSLSGTYFGNLQHFGTPQPETRPSKREQYLEDLLLYRNDTEKPEFSLFGTSLTTENCSLNSPRVSPLLSPTALRANLYPNQTPTCSYSELQEAPRNTQHPVLIHLDQSYDDSFAEDRRNEVIYYCKRSARSFLAPSPDFEGTALQQLPEDFFWQPVQERFLERRPFPVHPPDPFERRRFSACATPTPRQSRRGPQPAPSTPRYLTRRAHSYDRNYRSPMGRMHQLDDHDRKIIIEFCHLLEKSKQLFNGLRELPQYGHKQWQSYFGKTFDVYTKLWKFQQQHRAILDSKYGLKRWQIGEIASKIGQLYYHFYLRTSDTAYLSEAYSFYYAIRGRSYYTQACKEDKCELMVKKLRYYARFIVASLLLKKMKLVRDLLKELEKQIIEYGNAYEPDDQNEWRIVADEVRSFIKVEPVVSVHHPEEYVVILSHRLSPQLTPPVERTAAMNLSLQEVLIIGSISTQVTFSELTMDMFRMMQTLEREPSGDIQHMYDESPRQRYPLTPSAAKGYNLDSGSSKLESPHKYMLFKPSANQIFVFLASACEDLQPNGVVLLYISAEGLSAVPTVKHPENASGYDMGGVITTSSTDALYRETTKDGKPTSHKELHVLHPGDLFAFMRQPMVIIVDSDNSFAFNGFPRHFGQPLIVLMSPIELPTTLYPSTEDNRVEGSLFTLFLHCPLSAVCLCCDIKNMSLTHWERAQSFIDAYLAEASQILAQSRTEAMYVSFMGDDFLRLLILRFIFCETILRMHRMFRGRAQRTRASPPLPDDLYEHHTLTDIVIELVTHLQVRGQFHDPAVAPLSNRE